MIRSPWPLPAIPPRFPRWIRERYPSALVELTKLNDGSPRFWAFAWQCIECAEKARAWDRAANAGTRGPHEVARENAREFSDSRGGAAGVARQLAAHLQRYPTQSDWALMRASSEMEKDGSMRTTVARSASVAPHGGLRAAELQALLRAYAAELERNPPLHAGSFLWRFQLGAIHFEEPLDRRSSTPEPIETSLLFGLSLFAREYTDDRCANLQLPVPMPPSGRPMWPLAVAFLADALDRQLDEKAAANRINQLVHRHPGVGWMGWPEPPAEYLDTPPLEIWFTDTQEPSNTST